MDLGPLEALIVALVPLLVSQLKKLNIAKWVLPLIASALGLVLQVVSALATNTDPDVALGLLLGGLGIALRELIKHWVPGTAAWDRRKKS